MRDECVRFTIAWVPSEDTALGKFGKRWTGWCAEKGARHPRFDAVEIGHEAASCIERTSKLGLVAIMTSAAALAPQASRWSVEDAIDKVTEDTGPIMLPTLRLALVGSRLAIVPELPTMALERLMGRIQAALVDRLEIRRDIRPVPAHLPGGNAGARIALPQQAEGGFHLPLTDPIAPEAAQRIAAKIAPVIFPVLQIRPRIESLALIGEPAKGAAALVLARFPFSSEMIRRAPDGLDVRGPRLMVPFAAEDSDCSGAA